MWIGIDLTEPLDLITTPWAGFQWIYPRPAGLSDEEDFDIEEEHKLNELALMNCENEEDRQLILAQYEKPPVGCIELLSRLDSATNF